MKDFTADGSALTRSSDYGNCTRFKEKLQRVYGGYRLPPFELFASLFGKRRRKNDVKLSGAGVDLNRKPRFAEHVQHRVIHGHDVSLKNSDPVCCGDLRQLAEQNGAESASLKVVSNGKGDFGPLLGDYYIECVTHYTVLVATAYN
jgi:hypothetical protein